MRTAFVLLCSVAVCSVGAQTIEIRKAIALGGVLKSSRSPLPSDPIMEAMIRGDFAVPQAGVDRSGWQPIEAGKEGWFENDVLENAYVYVPVESGTDRIALLSAAGQSFVYVNGELRGGDPYGYGYLTLPIRLHKGRNDLLFAVGRGRLKASVEEVANPIALDLRDATTPDVLTDDKGTLLAGVVVRNAGEKPAQGLKIRATLPDGQTRTTGIPEVIAMSIRKVAVTIPTPKHAEKGELKAKLEVLVDGKTVDRQELPLRTMNPNEVHKRTFVSHVDGSVQYYAVNPAQKPSAKNVLTLTVHGASVEALGQAQAYRSKDDITIVAATNRRPYGFDWEDTGRVDALEVLDTVKRTIPHDPLRVHLTGHSMGGHGTWHIGTLYPDVFASIAPSAGWISFWSYAGGWNPSSDDATLALLRRSMNSGDTLARLRNTLAQGVFVLHGDADDNVPVEQARTMKAALEKLGHPDFGYHEVPGAGHWWSNEAVDFPAIFDMERRRKLNPFPRTIDFTTPNPAVSARAWWATIAQQRKPLETSSIRLELRTGFVIGTTSNVQLLHLDFRGNGFLPQWVNLDGQTIGVDSKDIWLESKRNAWRVVRKPNPNDKSPERGGPFKQVYDRRMTLVVPSGGTPEENAWGLAKARYDAETWYYRGNGSLDIVQDKDLGRIRDWRSRNLLLYGNADINKAWTIAVGDSPIDVRRGKVVLGARESSGSQAALFIRPTKGSATGLVAVIGGTDLEGMRRTDRLPIFTSGLNYPDWIVFDANGVVADGFFGNDWRMDTGEAARR